MSSRGILWSTEETKLLVDLWAEKQIQEKISKRCISNREIYGSISQSLQLRDHDSCYKRMQRLIRDYRKFKDDSKKTGGGELRIPPSIADVYPVIDATLQDKALTDPILLSSMDGGPNEKTVLFLHGNPTSSFLWRNIYPSVSCVARCFAPDLIGMGLSDKVPDIEYRFSEHYEYLSEWIDKTIPTEKINLVIHDWGSGLGFHWANHNRSRVESIIHMESIVCPVKSWDKFPEIARNIFQTIRSPAGEEVILQKNVFAERILPSSILRKLTPYEMEYYQRPFKNSGRDRLPTLTWPREIPVEGEGPEYMIEIVDAYSEWLSKSKDLPKLFINAEPGFFSRGIDKVTKNWPNHARVTVKGLHFPQEDSPREISTAIQAFLTDKVFNASSRL